MLGPAGDLRLVQQHQDQHTRTKDQNKVMCCVRLGTPGAHTETRIRVQVVYLGTDREGKAANKQVTTVGSQDSVQLGSV